MSGASSPRRASGRDSPPASPPPAASDDGLSAGSPGASPRHSAALWRQNTDLVRRNQELELEVQGLRAISVRRRLTSNSLAGSACSSRRASSMAGAAEEESTTAQLASMEAQLSEAQAGAATAQAELAAARAHVHGAQEQLASARAQVASLQDELTAARAQVAVAGAGVEQLSARLMEMQEVAVELQEQLTATNERLAGKEAEAAGLAAQLEGAEQEVARKDEEASAMQLELALAQAALEAAANALDAAEDGHIEALAAARGAAAGLERRVAELSEQLAAAEGAGKQAATEAAAAKRAAADMAEKYSDVGYAPKAAARAAQKARAGRRSRSASPPARTASSPASTRPCSPAEYGSGAWSDSLGLAPLAQLRAPGSSLNGSVAARLPCPPNLGDRYVVHTLLLPSPSQGPSLSEGDGVALACQKLEAEVSSLRERLRSAEAELSRQLVEKQAALLVLSGLSAEVGALHRERELLQEQAMGLQQEVSGWQQGSMLRGGPSGADVAAEATLERSPSRTLTSRMKELLSPSRLSVHTSPSSQPTLGQQRGHSASASPHTSPHAQLGWGHDCGQVGPLQEGELQRGLKQRMAALEQQVASQQAQLAEQAAGAAAALGAARQEYDALREQAGEAESAAEAVLALHSSGVVGASVAGLGGQGVEHKECKAAIEGIYAQMWRERLARQRAQAQATELRRQVSDLQAADFAGAGSGALEGSSSCGIGQQNEGNEAVMRSLETEMARADHLQDELRRYKAHQTKLQKRTEHLELQLAQYTSLLTAAEGVVELPCLRAGVGGSPRGVGGRPGSRCASPVQAAITAVQARKAVEEAAALREKLEAAQAEAAATRRRGRDTAASLKEARAIRLAMEQKQELLAAGLDTLHRLLARRSNVGGTGTPRSVSACGIRGPSGVRARESSQVGDTAMAVLSRLMKAVQAVEGRESQQVVISPQPSEPTGGESIMDGQATGEALSLVLGATQPGGTEDGLSDPFDISCLLPEGSTGAGSGCASAAITVVPAQAAAGAPTTVFKIHLTAASTQQPDSPAALGSYASSPSCGQEPDNWQLQAVRHNTGGASVTGMAPLPRGSSLTPTSRVPSRIPGPPPGTAPIKRTPFKTGSGSGGSPGKLARLLAPCRRLSPHATLSMDGQPATK